MSTLLGISSLLDIGFFFLKGGEGGMLVECIPEEEMLPL
jgi:hypothetical protein